MRTVWIFAGTVLIGVAALTLRQLHQSSIGQYSRTGGFFGSQVRIDVCYAPHQEQAVAVAVEEVWARFADIHLRMSVYDPQSDISRINRLGFSEAVEVREDTYQLIADHIIYYRLSGGVFDMTIGPLLQLWKQSAEAHILPTTQEIIAAKASMGIDAVELLPDHRVRLKRSDIKINIDSIGDGYAADEAAAILRRHGLENFLIDSSGELYAGGQSCRGRPWRVGVQDPQDPAHLIDTLELRDMAVSTSGIYQRYYEIAGKRYAHIIDPRTGYPVQDIYSATVIGPSARMADFLSTSLCVLSPAEGVVLIDSFDGQYASMAVLTEPADRPRRVQSDHYAAFEALHNSTDAPLLVGTSK
jgi:thiamine biosynthesis lipoprotein